MPPPTKFTLRALRNMRRMPLPDRPRVRRYGAMYVGEAHDVQLFPAAVREAATPQFDRIIEEGQSSCFFHPELPASELCAISGRLICDLCQTEWNGQTVSLEALQSALSKNGRGAQGQARTRWKKKFSGRSAFSAQNAYLGEHHLLIVDGVYTKNTKRIHYEDIEAILICPTKTGALVSILAGLGGLFFSIVAVANWQDISFVPWLIVALVIWVIFGLGLYHQGSVIFGVQTAVQTVVLDGLGSRRKSARAAERLAQRIEAWQGRLSTEALQAGHRALRSATWASRGRPKPTTGSAGPPPIQKNLATLMEKTYRWRP